MNINLKYILVMILVGASSVLQAASVRGIILAEDQQPLVGANVYLNHTFLGTASRQDGTFLIENMTPGSYQMTVSLIGYLEVTQNITLKNGEGNELDPVILKIGGLRSETIVVTASKYEQKRQDVPATLELITFSELHHRNTISVADALKYVSGINMNASQINIRGSSGYSYGVGSRVLMLIDGVPYLTGDTREINLESIPIHQIERIEIIKGAGSALYGSSAIGGVINIITKSIGDVPEFYARAYGGVYQEPYYPQWRWSDRNRYFSGIQLNYSRKIKNTGFMLGASHDYDDSYKRNAWIKRWKITEKLQFDLSPVQRLIFNSNYMEQKRGNFFYWESLDNALQPPEEQLHDQVLSKRFYVNGIYKHLLGHDRYYNVRAIWFRNHFEDNIGTNTGNEGNESLSDCLDLEAQYYFKRNRSAFTMGINAGSQRVESNIFGKGSGIGTAAYFQDEIAVSPRWQLTAGVRLDYFEIDSLGSDFQFNPKLGVVFKPRLFSAIRLSCGRGFRAPSMAEAFTSTTAGGLQVIPNTELQPEHSISYELGWNQIISQNSILDLAVFYNDYWDLIDGAFTDNNNIQFRNLTRAKISGIEATWRWQLTSPSLTGRLGYTYSYPRDLKKNEYLTYRPRHIFYNNVGWKTGRFDFTLDYRYLKKFDRIDDNFSLVIRDADKRIDAHIVDLRILFSMPGSGGCQISCQVNNLLQYHYVDLVGSIAPIRNILFTLEKAF
ncbi:MAG TPA: hypothetical protein DHW42_02240 [Candidatus Marinimicrobia bacterium]|nr:hypothetical protein [Candidatus Neomarinimicrobiota bacterium]